MEILTTQSNPVFQPWGKIGRDSANRNGEPVRSPLVRLQEILAESNSAEETLAFLPLRKSVRG